jgi:cellobiose epimerase
MRPISVLILILLVHGIAEPQEMGESLRDIEVRVERILLENILPFWYPGTVDGENGGYQFNHDVGGEWLGAAPKSLVAQARAVWFFSRFYNDGYGTKEHLEAARSGFEFLRDRMWDRVFGGFFWEMDHAGRIGNKPHKHLYGQAFALYGLSEYIQATQDSSAVRLADELFGLLEEHAYDREYGGYREWFLRDWGEAPPEQSYLANPPGGKLMNTHLHLMEAFSSYYLASGDELVRERLLELILIQSNAVVRKDLGACTDKYERDWTPLLTSEFARVSYGHDIENIWLLVEACRAAGVANGVLLDLYRQLMSYSVDFGFDYELGGFFNSGPFAAPAENRRKVWWVQAEGLVAALYMYELTGEERYFSIFTQTLDWIEAHQVDWENGDWYAVIEEEGTPSGGKAHGWKSPYHNGRSMLQCLQRLKALTNTQEE